jgi:NAD(P)-dependent dehydrogenase (short-subunit alcohol dehydrogenase family)
MNNVGPDLKSLRSIFDLDGRRAIVIGAGGGIGSSVAHGLAAFGAEVVCADVDLASAEKTAQQVREMGGNARSERIDVTSRDSVSSVFNELDSVDIVVLTAATNVRKRLLDMTLEEFRRVEALNLEGTFLVLRECGAKMAKQGRGSIVVFSSIRAQVVEPGQGVYAATKAGVLQLVRTLAAELGPEGVRVNAIAPGVVETALTAPIKADSDWYDAYAQKSVLRRWAQPEELVGATIFLASDASSYVTGSFLTVDGGWLAADGRFTPKL